MFLLVSHLILGSYFETSDDYGYVLLLRGILAPEPVDDLIHCWRGISHALSFLYAHLPRVPWYSIATAASVLISLMNCMAVVGWLSRVLHPTARLGVEIGFVGLLFAEHLVFHQFTRSAILLSSTAISCLILSSLRHGRIARRTLACQSLVFLLGFSIRPTGALFSFVLSLPLFAALLLRASPKAPILKAGAIVVALVGCASLANIASMDPAQQDYRKKHKLTNAYNDFGASLSSREGPPPTLELNLARALYFADEKINRMAFLERLVDDRFLGREKFTWSFFRKKVRLPYWKSYAGAVTGLLLGFCFLCLAAFRSEARLILLLSNATWLIGTGAVVVGVLWLLKLPPRLFGPLLTASALGLFLLLVSSKTAEDTCSGALKRRPAQLGMACLALLVALQLYATHLRASSYAGLQQAHEKKLADLFQRRDYSCLILTSGMNSLFQSLSPFSYREFEARKYVRIAGLWTLHPDFSSSLKALPGESFGDFLLSACDPHHQALFLSNPEQNLLLEEYLLQRHRTRIDFSLVGPKDPHYYKGIRTINTYRCTIRQDSGTAARHLEKG